MQTKTKKKFFLIHRPLLFVFRCSLFGRGALSSRCSLRRRLVLVLSCVPSNTPSRSLINSTSPGRPSLTERAKRLLSSSLQRGTYERIYCITNQTECSMQNGKVHVCPSFLIFFFIFCSFTCERFDSSSRVFLRCISDLAPN